jgi:hypothetical protein
MRAYGVMGHELVGDLFCERRIEATTNVDCHQFLMLALVVCPEFRALTREVGLPAGSPKRASHSATTIRMALTRCCS